MNEIMDFLKSLFASAAGNFQMFGICALIFIPLAIFFPNKQGQPLFHKGMIPDAFYWFFASPLIYSHVMRMLFGALLASGIYSVATLNSIGHQGMGPLASLPVILQAFLILLVMDVIQYWTHRVFHTMQLWKFHSIHHSAVHVDWLTSARFHPVNIIVHSSCVYLIVFLMGFSPQAWMVLAPFNMIYSPLVHANLNWTYGPFRYFLASPVFHRWHHTHPKEGGNKNFAPTFPFLDILFGTYYDPKGVKPNVFGAPYDTVSDSNVLQQLVYPFLRKRKIQTGETHAEV